MPAPYVVAIDAGHGGTVNNNDPSQPWDPGVVVGGVQEKNITLDLAFRLRSLLQQERVKVVMTRTTDKYVAISDRWDIAQAAGARLFVSLHVNAFDGDSSINGETILYPHPDSIPFAQAIDSSLAKSLAPYQIADDGIAAKSDLWIHSDVPTVTVEPVYLTNPREFSLLEQGDFRNAIVQGVFNGMLAYDPKIEATKHQIERAEAALAAQQRAEAAAAADAQRTIIVARSVAIAGAVILLLLLTRLMRRRPGREAELRSYHRRPYRRRRSSIRR
jgi:N-acetylmuramoyl-L-alanine amidase